MVKLLVRIPNKQLPHSLYSMLPVGEHPATVTTYGIWAISVQRKIRITSTAVSALFVNKYTIYECFVWFLWHFSLIAII